MKISTVPLAVAMAVGFSTPALADNASAIMQVRATVDNSCSIQAGAMQFELGNAVGDRAVSQATVALNCNAATGYELAMDAGANASGQTRRMVDPVSGESLPYEIYVDASRTLRWGNSSGVNTVAGSSAAGAVITLTAYGAIPAAITPRAPGSYSDEVVVTVNF